MSMSKQVDLKNAIKQIKSGNRIALAGAAGEAHYFVDGMVQNREMYENVEIVQLMTLEDAPYTAPNMQKHFRYNTIFASPSTREAIFCGLADFTPCNLHQVPWLFKHKLPIDVAMIQVSPPDEHGFCSYGVNVDYIKAGAENARIVIAQINEKMPRTLGDSFIHMDQISYYVKHNSDIREVMPIAYSDVERSIGENCAKLISDGDTLQVGIGGIPNAILHELYGKKDLGIHSELISDGVMQLMQEGIINNKKKTVDNGVTTTSFAMGTQKLYKFLHNNPGVKFMPSDYINNPLVIMKNEKFVSINSCLQIDLMGQVVAEAIGRKQYSGVGGQVDFIRGASMAKDGKSIIAMPSTAAKGKVSRIVVNLSPGSAITTSRNDVDYVVTEYGIADLKGKTLRERAKELINIAHPNFRKSLYEGLEMSYGRKKAI